MKLFLASEAKNPKSIETLGDYINGFKGKSIAYIPTAANAEEGWGVWKNGGTWKLVQSLGANLEMLQLEDYRNESVAKHIVDKDIVWFAGGMPGYLMYWIRRCSLDKILPEVLQKTIFVGSSAGAMIAGQTLQISSWGFVDSEKGAESITPLGLVNFDVFPHYEDQLYEKIKQNYKGEKLYLLKNGEQILVEDANIKVIGEERIISKT